MSNGAVLLRSYSWWKTDSNSSADATSSALARPIGTRKNTSQNTTPRVVMSSVMASMSSMFALRITVFTCVDSPTSWASRRMRRPWSKLPVTRRNSSWIAAFEPSRLIARRVSPAPFSSASSSLVARDVVAGVMPMRSPRRAP